MTGDPGRTRRPTDPGLAQERTQLAWSRTAISFAAVGAAILHTDRAAGAVVIAMSAAVWGIGRLPAHERAEAGRWRGLTRRRTVQLITVATTLVSLVALTLYGPCRCGRSALPAPAGAVLPDKRPARGLSPPTEVPMSPTLDLRDKSITTYIAYQATEALRRLDEGDVLEIHTADTEAIDNDIRAWCRRLGTGCCSPNPTTPAAATGSRSAPSPSADAASRW